MSTEVHPASFRDPSGFVFWRDGMLLRHVDQSYRRHYDHLMQSGLYDHLVRRGLLLPHAEVSVALAADSSEAYKVLQPEPIRLVSYPFEWCFSQIQDAALVTCELQVEALKFGMSLKDASAYNIQWVDGRPVLIDTLSFEIHEPGRPWIAYRQFCQHFLAPLALASYTDRRLTRLMRIYLDGVPLDLAVRLLPWRARFNSGLLMHLFLQARVQQHMQVSSSVTNQTRQIEPAALAQLVAHLRRTVRRLRWNPAGEWRDYYESAASYSTRGFDRKKELVAEFARAVRPRHAWDLGGNIGAFAEVVRQETPECLVVTWDNDEGCVEAAYRRAREQRDPLRMSLLIDLTNPSPDLGWHHRERMSLERRGPVDLVLALALVHHMTIGNNVPFTRLADFLAALGRWLIIEFVPAGDPQADQLLKRRLDKPDGYSRASFEAAFERVFSTRRAEPLPESKRILFLMERLPACA